MASGPPIRLRGLSENTGPLLLASAAGKAFTVTAMAADAAL